MGEINVIITLVSPASGRPKIWPYMYIYVHTCTWSQLKVRHQKCQKGWKISRFGHHDLQIWSSKMIDPDFHTDFSQGFRIRSRKAIWIKIFKESCRENTLFGLILGWLLDDFGMILASFGHELGMIWAWFGHDSDMIWAWFGHDLGMIWPSFGVILGSSWGHPGVILGSCHIGNYRITLALIPYLLIVWPGA